MNPFSLLLRAIRAVPAVKYALGVLGIAAVVAIVKDFGLGLMVAVLGVLIVVIGMILLRLFEHLARSRSKQLNRGAFFLMWLALAAVVLLLSSVFFNFPIPRQDLGLPWHPSPPEVKIESVRLIRDVKGSPILEVVVRNESNYAIPLLALDLVGEHDSGLRCQTGATEHTSWERLHIDWPAVISHRDPRSAVWTTLGPQQRQISGTAKFKAADCSNYSDQLKISVPLQADVPAHQLARVAFDVEEDWRGGRRMRGADAASGTENVPGSLFEWDVLQVMVETGGGAVTEMRALEK